MPGFLPGDRGHGTAGPWAGSPYTGYLYAYPHKSAYRPLRPRPELRQVWAGERVEGHFLYLHVPFCEARCGFCNLFTRAGADAEHQHRYVRQIDVQAQQVAGALAGARFAAAAIGGGTPTCLPVDDLASLLGTMRTTMGLARSAPLSVETSPGTATAERLAVLAEAGIARISMGVQSFLASEVAAVARPQRRDVVERALSAIRDTGVPVLNLDLIYGIPGQTARTWTESLLAALAWQPEEIYLYPLYVRPLTGLGRRGAGRGGPDPQWDTQRLELYRLGRDRLLAEGYRQLSMRHFRRHPFRTAGDMVNTGDIGDTRDIGVPAVEYNCQDDGMVGLGCGARSYTRALHYSFDYAVGQGAVRSILDDYVGRRPEEFALAEVGFWLDDAEQRRRWVVKSLLRAEGLDRSEYAARFGNDPLVDLPELVDLVGHGLADQVGPVPAGHRLVLTAEGLARSDAIGSWLISARVSRAMAEAVPR